MSRTSSTIAVRLGVTPQLPIVHLTPKNAPHSPPGCICIKGMLITQKMTPPIPWGVIFSRLDSNGHGGELGASGTQGDKNKVSY